MSKTKQAEREVAAYHQGRIDGHEMLIAMNVRHLADLDDVIEQAKAKELTDTFVAASELRAEVLSDIERARVALAALGATAPEHDERGVTRYMARPSRVELALQREQLLGIHRDTRQPLVDHRVYREEPE